MADPDSAGATLGRPATPPPSREPSVSDAIVVLRKYASELEARLAAAILEANGIPAQALADDTGGAYPSMAVLFPVRLLVRAEDAAVAAKILDTPADGAPEADRAAP